MDNLRIPHNIDAEKGVLGSMLCDDRCIPDVLSQLTADDFYSEVNREIFRGIAGLFDAGQAVDFITVPAAVNCKDVSHAELTSYICGLVDATPTTAHVMAFADVVKENSVRRATLELAHNAAQLVNEGALLSEVQDALQRAQDVTAERQAAQVITMSEAASKLYAELDERVASGGSVSGLQTGFTELDKMTGGLHPGNMIVLASRSGGGKTAKAVNTAVNATRLNNCTVLIFSLEMNAVELCERVFANHASINLYNVRDARMTDSEWAKLSNTARAIAGYDIRIVESPNLDINEISRISRRVKPALVIIDHIGLVRPSSKHRDRREAMDGVSRSIKCLAKDLKIPVMILAQLNRQIMARQNKTPVLSDLRESGAIEQDADVVIFIDRPAYYDPEKDKSAANLIVAKNRHGATGTIPLFWTGEYQRFEDDWTKTADDLPLTGTFGGESEAAPVQEGLPI